MLWKLIKLLEIGRIQRDRLSITSAGKSDGVGAQALAKFSAMCMAEAYHLKYTHTPFTTLAHAEHPIQEWVEAWENLLGLFCLSRKPEDTGVKVCELEEYIFSPRLWNEHVCLSTKHFHPFCELAPQYGKIVAHKLQEFYWQNAPESEFPNSINVCVHIRRGDVRPNNPETRHRFTRNSEMIPLVEWVLDMTRRQGRQVRLHLYSNGKHADFSDFPEFPELEYHLDASAMETFQSLAAADILVTTRSDFSHLAAIYCRGIVICDPRHRTPLPEWVRMDRLQNETERRMIEAEIDAYFSK